MAWNNQAAARAVHTKGSGHGRAKLVDDRPRLLKDEEQIALRRAELSKRHIVGLAKFAESLRGLGLGKIPDFDPWDGGVDARVLFLIEKPGRKAFASGFISRNNNDQTAENTFKFMERAKIPRRKTCLWNVIPGWNGTTKIAGHELKRGAEALSELIKPKLLPNLKVVVLVGRRAAEAWSRIGSPSRLPTIESMHPSPINYACARAEWDAIPSQWAQVHKFLR